MLKKKDIDKQIIKREYGITTDIVSRLAMYALSSPIEVESELGIEEKQDNSSAADLIALALSARRLIVASNSVKIAKDAKIVAARSEELGPISVWEFLGIVIHNEFLDLLRTEAKKIFYFSKDFDDALHKSIALGKTNPSFKPLILVNSDKSPALITGLADFITVFSNDVLYKILRYCEDELKIFLSAIHDDI